MGLLGGLGGVEGSWSHGTFLHPGPDLGALGPRAGRRGWCRYFLQHAIDTQANAEEILERFEMNVRGSKLRCYFPRLLEVVNNRRV